MLTTTDLIARIAKLDADLAEDLRGALGESIVHAETADFIAENVKDASESDALLFNDVTTGAETQEWLETMACEAANDSGKRLLEQYTFLDRPTRLNIPKDRHEKYEDIEREGQSPMYVVWEMPSGYSRYMSPEAFMKPDAKPSATNRHRYWSPEVMHSLVPQINSRRPVGYMGHADFFSMSQLPENIPVQWERAVRAKRKSDGVDVNLVRGYIYDNGMNRAHIKTGAIDSASVFTVGEHELDTTDKGTKDNPVVLVKSAALISFDLVRKHNHGLPGTKRVENLAVKESIVPRTAEERATIASATVEEIRQLNPDVVAALETAQTSDAGLVEDLRTRHRTAVQDGLRNERHAAVVERLSEQFGCDLDEVLANAETMLSAQRAGITEAITVHCSSIKSESLRENIRTRLSERKFEKPSDVKAAFEKEISAMHDMAKEMAGENSLGSLSNNTQDPSLGENLVSSEWAID